MSSKIVDIIKTNFVDITSVKYIYNACIIDIKIKHINIFSKIIGHGKIAIYGDYELFILYEVRQKNNKCKYLLKTEIKKFYKTIPNCKANNYKKDIDYLIEVNFAEKPKCIYRKGYFRQGCYYRWFNLCKILLFGELVLNIYSSNSQTYDQLPEDKTEKLCNYKISQEQDTLKTLIDANLVISNSDKDSFNSENYSRSPEDNTKKSCDDKTSQESNTLKALIDANLVTPNGEKDSFNSQTCNRLLEDNTKKSCDDKTSQESNTLKTLIDTNVVIANGEKDCLINNEIILSADWPAIWKIQSVDYYVDIDKKDVIKENIIVSGFVNTNINYKTYENSINGIVNGNISYVESRIPFTQFIKMKHSDNITLDKDDNCKILESIIIDGIYNLQEPNENSNGILQYRKIKQSMLLKIKAIVTRIEIIEIEYVDK